MRFLISVAPAASHLQPVVPLAHALEARGHVVAVVCPPAFRRNVESLGLEAIPAGLDWLRAEPERFFPDFAAAPPAARCNWLITHVYASAAPARLFPEFLALCRRWQPDVVLRDQAEFAAWLAAERLGLPHVSWGYGLGQLEQELALMRPPLQALRRSLDFPPDYRLETLYRHLRLEFAPALYLPPEARPIPRTHHLRFDHCDDEGEGELPSWVAGLGGRPLVVATLGNNYNRIPGLFEAIIAALAGRDLDLVLAIGSNRRPEEFGLLPPNVHVTPYVPLSRLLPRADLLLCHAGFNTIMTAVIAGTPMVLLPIDSDQPVHAERCRALAMARVVGPDPGTGPGAGPGLVRALDEAVGAALDDPGLRQGVVRFREALRALPGAENGAMRLEGLAAREPCP